MLRTILKTMMVTSFLFLVIAYIIGTDVGLLKMALAIAASVFFVAFIIGDES